ncbi:MAG: phytanoyl-CoA dioxygenase family protein [Polyangiaceae bacterium]
MGGFQLRHHFRAKSQAPGETEQLVGGELERRVHAGDLVVFQRNALTAELVARVRAEIRACFPELETNWDDLSLWPCSLLEFSKLADLRERLYSDPKLHQLAARIISAAGFDAVTCVDAPRLRVINHEAEQRPEAAPLFVVHRDTWYACPESQINWWVPIFKTPVEQAFAFYPEHFDREVENTSQSFDYGDWMERVGWHGRTALDDYPAPTRYEPQTTPVRFDFEAGDLLLFSAAHLHRTLPNPVAGSSRVSLDFRTVTPGVRGARNVDNGSGGALERVRREFVPLRYLV